MFTRLPYLSISEFSILLSDVFARQTATGTKPSGRHFDGIGGGVEIALERL